MKTDVVTNLALMRQEEVQETSQMRLIWTVKIANNNPRFYFPHVLSNGYRDSECIHLSALTVFTKFVTEVGMLGRGLPRRAREQERC